MPLLSVFGRLAILILLTLSPARGDDTDSNAAAPVLVDTPEFRHELEQETFFLINKYRKENQMTPLAWSDAITKVARGHSKDMATGDVDFGHEGFRDRVDKVKDIQAGFRGAGENVLETGDPEDVAQKAVALWLKSPPHLHNIRGDYNYSGLGIWISKDGTIYFTQVFIKFEPPAKEEIEAQAPPPVTSPFGLFAPTTPQK